MNSKQTYDGQIASTLDQANTNTEDRLTTAVAKIRLCVCFERASRNGLIKANEAALDAVYALYFPFAKSLIDWQNFCNSQGWDIRKNQKYHVSTAIKELFRTYDEPSVRTKTSEWASVIAAAAKAEITPDDFIEQVRALGGISAAAKAARRDAPAKSQLDKVSELRCKLSKYVESHPSSTIEQTVKVTDMPPNSVQACLVEVGDKGDISIIAHTTDEPTEADVDLLSKVLRAATISTSTKKQKRRSQSTQSTLEYL